MEVMSFHQVAQRLGLKGGQPRVANLPVAPTNTKKGDIQSAWTHRRDHLDVTV